MFVVEQLLHWLRQPARIDRTHTSLGKAGEYPGEADEIGLVWWNNKQKKQRRTVNQQIQQQDNGAHVDLIPLP